MELGEPGGEPDYYSSLGRGGSLARFQAGKKSEIPETRWLTWLDCIASLVRMAEH